MSHFQKASTKGNDGTVDRYKHFNGKENLHLFDKGEVSISSFRLESTMNFQTLFLSIFKDF